MIQKKERAYFLFSGLLMAVGAAIFMNGGRQHPIISSKMGKLGTMPFFHNFAMMITSDPHWMEIHAQILGGPVMFCLGSLGLVEMLRRRGERLWGQLGFVSLVMGTVLWAAMYVFDGFVAPEIAPKILSSSPTLQPVYATIFSDGQWFVIRVSMVSWLLIAAGITCIAASLLMTRRQQTGRASVMHTALGVTGVLIGVWPFIAWMRGLFSPGPMVSPWYDPTAIVTGIWFVVTGIWVCTRSGKSVESPAPADTAAQPAARAPAQLDGQREPERV